MPAPSNPGARPSVWAECRTEFGRRSSICGYTNAPQQKATYSITSSARVSTVGGTSTPSAGAVGRFMTSSPRGTYGPWFELGEFTVQPNLGLRGLNMVHIPGIRDKKCFLVISRVLKVF